MGISEQSVRSGNTEYPLHNVKRIEILAGPAAALHGSGAFSGTINIITKDGKGNPGNSIDVTYGTWESNFRNPSYMTNFSVRGSGKQDESFQYSVSGYYYKTQGPNFGQNQHLDKKILIQIMWIMRLNQMHVEAFVSLMEIQLDTTGVRNIICQERILIIYPVN
ncbi:MAG: hypothetical protein IPL26_00640 [Leptospiraceae bacterium]|nr:hypothetical protein [Leptospiraceae bacterium]